MLDMLRFFYARGSKFLVIVVLNFWYLWCLTFGTCGAKFWVPNMTLVHVITILLNLVKVLVDDSPGFPPISLHAP